MSRFVALYTTQIRVLREWRGGRAALLKRLVIVTLVSIISFAVTAWLLPGLQVTRLIGAVEMIAVMAILNAVVRPAVLAFLAPRSLILTGIAVLVIQVLVFFIAAQVVPDVHVDSLVSALVASFVFAIVNVILTSIVGVDMSDSFYGLLVQQLLIMRDVTPTDKPGLVMLQIDGLAYPILAGRIRAGSVNTMSRWLREGTHTFSRWEALLPSMTSASQAGILHGNNDGIPAFRWWERDQQRLMVSSNPKNAAEIVSRVSNGEGLLSNNGVSICNLVTGDATRAYLTTAALAEGSKGIGESNAFLSFFFSRKGKYTNLRDLIVLAIKNGARAGNFLAPKENAPTGCSKSPSSKAAADESTGGIILLTHPKLPRQLASQVGYVEDAFEGRRTPHGKKRVSARWGWAGEKCGFFSILLR